MYKLNDKVRDTVRGLVGRYKGGCVADERYAHVLLDGRGSTIVIELDKLEKVGE